MPAFGAASLDKLSRCHPDLQRLFQEVVKTCDCQIITGFRNKEDQDKAVASGLSKTPWPTGNHNSDPSRAVDAAPYPVQWDDTGNQTVDEKRRARFYYFAGYVKAVADRMGIRIRYGGDWNSNGDFADQTFMDLDHFELA